MAEARPRPEMMPAVAPDYIGAVFETGRSRSLVYDWVRNVDVVPVLDVLKPQERNVWALENIRVFSDGTLASPELKWKPVVDFWLTELKVAATNAELSPKERQKTEKDIRAIMAVSASARAMEQSAGVAEKYALFITGGDGDLDKQDSWAEFLLHRDSDKLKRVVRHNLVKHYYKKLIEDAGIEITTPKPEEEKKEADWLTEWDWKIPDRDKILKGDLVKHLEKGEGFSEYIADVLLADEEFRIEQLEKGFGDGCLWAAARLACDAFLVDKYTKWEYELDQRKIEIQREEGKKVEGLRLKPSPGWGGNPLRAVLEPAFLPRRIKEMYQKEDKAILEMTDLVFRPIDYFKKISEEFERKIARGEAKPEDKPQLLPSSMVVHLKAYARYNSALWTFLGSSRGMGIPQWTEKMMYEELPSIAELLDQVYGGIDKPEANTGKHIVGAMMARILQCKALATAVESARPGFRENIAVLFGAEIARPFLKIEQYIWGPHLDAKRGFLASLAGGRTRFVFKNNQFKAERNLTDAWEILSTNDQDPRGRGKAKMLNTIGFILDAAKAIAAGQRK